ncbi:hypothetical protein ACFL5G_04680 [Candidatus Margulisiibacteriota bacterium]
MKKLIFILLVFSLLLNGCGITRKALDSEPTQNPTPQLTLNDSYVTAPKNTLDPNDTCEIEVVVQGNSGSVSYAWAVMGFGNVSATNNNITSYTAPNMEAEDLIVVVLSDEVSTVTKSLTISVCAAAPPPPATPILISSYSGGYVNKMAENGQYSEQIQLPGGSIYTQAMFTPDKNKIFLVAFPYSNSLYRIDSNGTNMLGMMPGGASGDKLFLLDISPDSSTLIYKLNETIYTCPVENCYPSTAWTPAGIAEDIDSVRWSPDGTRIAFVTKKQQVGYADYDGNYCGDIYVANVDGSSPILIKGGYYRINDWSPDGTKILATDFNTGSMSKSKVVLISGDGSVEDRTPALNTTYARCFSPDGTKILFSHNAETWIADASGPINYSIWNGGYGLIPDWK